MNGSNGESNVELGESKEKSPLPTLLIHVPFLASFFFYIYSILVYTFPYVASIFSSPSKQNPSSLTKFLF